MDPTLTTVLLLLIFATTIALIQVHKRDKCLKDFDTFHVTLAEKGGALTWGRSDIYPSGLEISYVEPVQAKEGHYEQSFLFYKEQFDAIDSLYRYGEGLTPAEKERRHAVIKQTAQPTLMRRLQRRARNWISMVRDALLQAVSLAIGAARTRAPGSAVLSTQEAQLKSLSNEIIGHAGNAFDPLLEAHLFQQVVLEVTRNGRTHSYCGWLKDYTSQFVEVVDAVANPPGRSAPVEAYAPDDARLGGLSINVEDHKLHVANSSRAMLFIERVTAGSWMRPMNTVLPPEFTANLQLPSSVPVEKLRVHLGTADRVDMIVPRAHAIVRHAARLSQKASKAAPKPSSDGPAHVSASEIYSRT